MFFLILRYSGHDREVSEVETEGFGSTTFELECAAEVDLDLVTVKGDLLRVDIGVCLIVLKPLARQGSMEGREMDSGRAHK